MKTYSKVLLLLLVTVFSFTTSCKKKGRPEETTTVISEAVAKYVSYISTGDIFPEQPIEIVFIDDQVSDEIVGVEQENTILKFKPSVKGKIIWKSRKTLNFVPNPAWEMRQYYEVTVDLPQVSEQFKDFKEEFSFNFYAEGQEVELFNGELVLKERNNPKILKYVGKIAFKMPVEKDVLQEAMRIKKGRSDIKIKFEDTGNQLTYTFESADLPRTDKSDGYKLTINDKDIGLSSEYTADFDVTPLSKMLVKSIKAEETGQHPRIRVIFSDDLEGAQDITNYFSVNPKVNLKISKSGNSVLVDGSFKYGESYELSIKPGITSRWATKMNSDFSEKVKFSDLEPSLEFASNGIILPSSNKSKIQFRSANVNRVHLEVKQVFNNRIPDFIRQEEFSGSKNRKNGFSRNYGGQTGVIVYNKTLELGNVKNEWLLNEIELEEIFSEDKKGLYLIKLNFNPRDMMVEVEELKNDYVADKGEIYKPIIVSNLGITAKKVDDYYNVFVTDLITTKPVSGAKVSLYKWNDSPSKTSTTNSSGYVSISSEYSCRFITAEVDGQISYLKLDNMEWNTSGFDISGVSTNYSNQRAYFYTERGVYRPGDKVNLSMIIRNREGNYPDNHPITFKLYNPDGQNVLEKTLTDGKDGFYNFGFATKESDPTGNWEVRVYAGNSSYSKTIKIETVVPLKLKVKVESEKNKIGWQDKKYDYSIKSNYLFGTPAKGLKYDAEVEITKRRISFPKYQNFNFNNKFTNFSNYNATISQGILDTNGTAKISWTIPDFENIPSGLAARFVTSVYEKGGRQNTNRTTVPIDKYKYYVGLQNASYYYHYVTTHEESSLHVICVDPDGKPAAGKKINYRIYQNSSHWWYHYDNRREYQLRYKTDNNTTLVKEGSVTAGKDPVNIKFTPREDGDYLLEIQEGGYDGHMVSQFIYSYGWGAVPSGDQNAGTLMMKADKAKYNLGDVAKIRFPAPNDCAILYSLERENEVIEWRWIKNTAKKGKDMEIEVPVTEDMVPNAYVTISVIQPHSQTQNDRPMRMFGILPIQAEDPNTRQNLDIKVASELKPNKPFEVTVQTRNHAQTQFTIAVVDEGLLDLTNFRTPDPWSDFFRKIRLNIRTFDLFSQIIGVNKGDPFKVFSIGGGMDFREEQLNPRKGKRRFKPVCLFKGPLTTNSDGKATVKFEMPEYNGSVRIMVVSADGNSFGNAEKTVPVKTDLMVEPSIPRVLGPGEDFVVPVNVFAMKDKVGKVTVSVKVEGPLEVSGTASKTLTFTKADDQECFFSLKAKKAEGQAKIIISASSTKMTAVSNTDIMVRPSSTRQYKTEEKIIKPGQTASFTIPNNGLSGTNKASLLVQVFPNMNFGHRLDWLVRYPYGCVEQTTSSVLPQLYLKTFLEDSEKQSAEIDKNIDAGIERLTRFQTSSGGMAYWPGGTSVSDWSSIYVAHFLVEAKELGYHVPTYFYDNLMEYHENKARYSSSEKKFSRVYRAYILSKTDKSVSSELNRIKQDKINNLSDVQKHLLAAAFYNTGKKTTAEEIMSNTGRTYDEYDDFSYSFGSSARDMGFVLNAYVDMEDKENARLVAEEIAKVVSGRDWYSTQTLGHMLLAMGRYFEMIGLNENSNANIKGYYLLNGQKTEFGPDKNISLPLNKGFGKEIQVVLDKDIEIPQAYVNVNWSGVPLMDSRPAESKRIKLDVEWLDENGKLIDPSILAQATTIYGHFRVMKDAPVHEVSELALVQILPSGWEIENLRLSGDQLPDWTSNWSLNNEDFLDIRDDRIMWFFDLRSSSLDFIVKINVISQGNFYMPPTVCEAMYNNNYYAIRSGQKVQVIRMGR